jgi:purine-binding chemotaxis protein CheW
MSVAKSILGRKKGPWATFNLADETFAVSAEDIQEVLIEQPLTPVPLAPKHIVGLLNLRGQVMAAIDLRTRLYFEPREAGAQTSLLVLKLGQTLVSVVVDSIGDVLDLPEQSWEAPPQTLSMHHKKFVFGICPTEAFLVLGLEVSALEMDDDQQDKEGMVS